MQWSALGVASVGLSEGEKSSDAESLSPPKKQLTAATLNSQHPFEDREELRSCVRLLDANAFASLPTPLPRAQDLPEEYFSAPLIGDEVISVSHAWRNQAHPDPTCQKTRLLAQLLSKFNGERLSTPLAAGKHPRMLLFLDFVSIPQKPFRIDQEPRTPLQAKQFLTALQCMHEAFFYSDRIIHLPWEDAPVPGEGIEVIVPAAELQGATFSQFGSVVQIAGFHAMPTKPGHLTSSNAQKAHLFDQVMSVDDQEVSTPGQLEGLLASGAKEVKLRSYPFGMSSNIPADARGWVFLERFITMVKCAMVDQETAKKIVITPSEAIIKEIMTGASRLREAAVKDQKSRKSEELKRVLEGLTKELHGKQFTPASTDKRELQVSTPGIGEDRNIVHSIMQQFATHLATHWEAEAAKQRSLATRLSAVIAATEDFLLEWDCFSEEYAHRLVNASKMNPQPVAILVSVPLAITLGILLAPYDHPEQNWREQTIFWACSTVMWFWCMLVFPTFLAHASGILCTATEYRRFSLWALATTAATQVAGMGVATKVFPIPSFHVFGAIMATATLPASWWCIPADKRSSSQFRVRLFYAFAVPSLVISMLGVGLPLLNAAIAHASETWQVVLVAGYLAVKLIFEACGKAMSRRLGADTMMYVVFWATYSYQINLCMAFSKVTSWLVVVEQICFDVLENLYHLWSLRSARSTVRREEYIVASLVLREFVELVVPLQFLTMYWLIKKIRPQYSAFLCNRSEEEVQQTERILYADISVEFIVSCLTYIVLVRRGHSPLLTVRGVVATRFVPMMVMASAVLVYYCCLQHTHWGMDLSFRFLWLREEEATWVCGLTWKVSG